MLWAFKVASWKSQSTDQKATSVVDGGKEAKGPISIRDGSAALAITHGDLP